MTDPRERAAVRARLALVGPAPAGWVPGPPTGARDDPGPDARVGGSGGPGGDRVDEPRRDRVDEPAPSADGAAARRALAAAMASYTAAHGHPLDGADAEPPARFRLATPARVAVAGLVGLLIVAGVVAVRVGQRTPTLAVPLSAGPGGAEVVLGPSAGEPAGGSGGASGGVVASPAAPGPDGGGPAVVVHVVGAVAEPGVVRLPVGSRVADAVAAAGGPTAEADLVAVNLARVLADGEQVVVPVPGQDGGTAGTAGATGGADGPELVDLNRADAGALDALPGIGPVLADRIVAWRERNGRFTAVEELTEVTGIGPALLAGVRDLVRVG